MGKPTTTETKNVEVETEIPVEIRSYQVTLPKKDDFEYQIAANFKKGEERATFIARLKADTPDKNLVGIIGLGHEDGKDDFRVYARPMGDVEGEEAYLGPATADKVIGAFKAVGVSGGVSDKELKSLYKLTEVLAEPTIKKHKFEAEDIKSIEDAVAQVIESSKQPTAKSVPAK